MNEKNENVQKLIDALTLGLPTAEEIRDSMWLAYRIGKVEGGIELADKMLNTKALAA